MNTRNRSKIVLAARAVGIVVPMIAISGARAGINGPYTPDASTVMLFHLDEASAATVAANTVTTGASGHNGIAFNQNSATVAGAASTSVLGLGTAFTGFGGAASFAGATSGATTGTSNTLIGFDGNGDGSFSPDFGAANPGNDTIGASTFTSANGSFTIDALVNLSFLPTSATGNHEIVSFDSSNGSAGNRGFQFRIQGATLIFDNIADGVAAVSATIPTTGVNAAAANAWFHVAMSYDGSAASNQVKLYWTAVTAGTTLANQIGTGSQNKLQTTGAGMVLTLGNENRNIAQESLDGQLDEVRISNTVRSADQFIFNGTTLSFWNNAGGGSWDTTANWTNGVPNSVSAIANFGGGGTPLAGDAAITLLGTKTIGAMTIDNAAHVFSIMQGDSTGGLLLNNGASAASITINTGSHQIDVPTTVGVNGVGITVNAGSTLTYSGAISGGALTKTGGGVLILSSILSTNTGATTVSAGALRANDTAGLSAGSNLVLSGGWLEPTGGSFSRAVGTGAAQVQLGAGTSGFSALGNDTTINLGGAGAQVVWGSASFNPTALLLNAGTATNNITFANAVDLAGGARTVEVDGTTGTATVSGVVSDSLATGSLTKTGAGTLNVTGNNNFAGTLGANGGILRVVDGVGLPAAANLSINGGLVDLMSAAISRGVGTGAGQIQIPGGASGFIANGQDVTVSLGGNSTIVWGSPAFAPTTLLFNLTTSTNNFSFTNGLDLSGATRTIQVAAGTVTYSGAISDSTNGTAGALSVQGQANVPSMLIMTHANNTYAGGTNIGNNNQNIPFVLRVLASNALGTGVINNGSIGNSTTSQLQIANNITLPNPIDFWARSVGNTVPAIESLSGDNTLAGTLTVGVGGGVYAIQSDAGTLTLSGSDPAAGGVSIIGGSAVTGNPAGLRTITLQGNGNGVILGKLQDATSSLGITKAGAGTWTIAGNNSVTGPVTVTAGMLAIGGSSPGISSVTVNDGSVLGFAPSGNGVLGTPSLNLVGSTPVVDMANGTMFLPGGDPNAIRQFIQFGYNGGGWNGIGILTSLGASNPKEFAVGYGVASDVGITTIKNTAIPAGALLVRGTYVGDASLDGKVDLGNDFNLFLEGFLGNGLLTSSNDWTLGDFNYDGSVDMTDFGMFIDGFKAQGGSLGELDGVIINSSLLSNAQKASLLAVVPEPAMAGVLVMAGVMAATRRRRRDGI